MITSLVKVVLHHVEEVWRLFGWDALETRRHFPPLAGPVDLLHSLLLRRRRGVQTRDGGRPRSSLEQGLGGGPRPNRQNGGHGCYLCANVTIAVN